MKDDYYPLISIIICNYNYGRFLEQCIESALGQTYPNIEVIVVDDGSTDSSLKIISKFNSRVSMVNLAHRGVAMARNTGAQKSKGELISFLDADDYLDENFIGVLYESLLKDPVGSFAYCDMNLFGAESGVLKSITYSQIILLYRNYISISALMYKDNFLSSGGFSPDFEELSHEDWDFWLTLAEKGKRGVYINQPLYNWRRHANGSRNNTGSTRLEEISRLLQQRHPRLYKKRLPFVRFGIYSLNEFLPFLSLSKLSKAIDAIIID